MQHIEQKNTAESNIGSHHRGDHARRQLARILVDGALALLMSVPLLACGESVRFNVMRPSKINVKQMAGDAEPTVAIGAWSSTDSGNTPYANEVAQYLRELIVNAESRGIKFAEQGGVVTLHGNMMEHKIDEHVSNSTGKCNKTDGNGKSYETTCTYYKREGEARVRVSLNVIDAKGITVAADTASCVEPRQTSSVDEDPPAIDWDAIALSCRHTIAANLAKNVVPYRVEVEKPWFDCGDANDQCKAGLNQLRAANFDQAVGIFQQAQSTLQASADNEAKAAVEWALTLAYEFSGDYSAAEEHITSAVRLNPSEQAYAGEVAAIREEEASSRKLAAQGAL